MSIAIPLHKRIRLQGWKTVCWRFAIMRPVFRRAPRHRHAGRFVSRAYSSRLWAIESGSRIKWGSYFDSRKVEREPRRKDFKGHLRVLLS